MVVVVVILRMHVLVRWLVMVHPLVHLGRSLVLLHWLWLVELLHALRPHEQCLQMLLLVLVEARNFV